MLVETECIMTLQRRPRSLIFGTNRKRIWDFLLVFNGNLVLFSHTPILAKILGSVNQEIFKVVGKKCVIGVCFV